MVPGQEILLAIQKIPVDASRACLILTLLVAWSLSNASENVGMVQTGSIANNMQKDTQGKDTVDKPNERLIDKRAVIVMGENEACAKLVEQLGDGLDLNLDIRAFTEFVARRIRHRIPEFWRECQYLTLYYFMVTGELMEWWQVAGLSTVAWVMLTLWRDTEPEDDLDDMWQDVGGEGGGA